MAWGSDEEASDADAEIVSSPPGFGEGHQRLKRRRDPRGKSVSLLRSPGLKAVLED
jgi:hypothetical protein